MKIAVNRCFGGFGLSHKAMSRLGELKGTPIYCYQQTKYAFDGGTDEFVKVNDESVDHLFLCYTHIDFGGKTDCLKDLIFMRSIARDDPNLIKVIEELGTEEASGQCACVEIVEIPDGVDWEIEEYDGSEHISECHRTW